MPPRLPPNIRTLPPPPPLVQDPPPTTFSQPFSLPAICELLATFSGSSGQHATPNPQISLGYGIPSIPKKTRDSILAGEYIDFSQLPPAKGKTCPLSLPAAEGNIILVNAADLIQQKKLIPDVGTWVQCFLIYAGTICAQSPGRLPDLLSYLYKLTRASQRYKWPSWVIFDQNYRQEIADRGSTELSHLDPTLYAQCFDGQAKEGNAWCQHCHSLEHSSDMCPLKPPPTKRPKTTPEQLAPQPNIRLPNAKQVCRNYNYKPKGCKFGTKCTRIHQCMGCTGRHPQTQCPTHPYIPEVAQPGSRGPMRSSHPYPNLEPSLIYHPYHPHLSINLLCSCDPHVTSHLIIMISHLHHLQAYLTTPQTAW